MIKLKINEKQFLAAVDREGDHEIGAGTLTMIDPPEGWRYGFPKPIPRDQMNRTLEWLVEQGYPKELITPTGFYCRYWECKDE